FARRLALKEFGGSPFKRVSARGIFRYGGAYGTAIRRSRGEVAPAEKFPAKIAFHSHLEHAMEELGELQEIVEHGPNWYALDRIEIRHAWQNGTETIEQMTIEDHR